MPTKQALVQRPIIADPLCERCQAAVEDPLHALWSFSKLEVVWADQGLWSFRNSIGFVDFKDLVSWIILEGKHWELFALTT